MYRNSLESTCADLTDHSSAEWTATKTDQIALIEELRKFQAKMSEMSGGHQLGRSVDLKKFTVSDVLEAIRGAMARAKSSKETSTYKFICTIGKHGEVLKQWLGLLPAGDYGSSICGMYDPLELLPQWKNWQSSNTYTGTLGS
jgi:hypothetical protein